MSTHVISSGGLPDWDQVRAVTRLARRQLREPTAVTETDVVTEGTGEDTRLVSSTVSLVFNPDLTAEEQTRLARLQSIAASAVALSPEELENLLPTLRGLRNYHGLASPTPEQTVSAVKGLTRVVAALLRE